MSFLRAAHHAGRRARAPGAAAGKLAGTRALAGALLALTLLLGPAISQTSPVDDSGGAFDVAAATMPADWMAQVQRWVARREYRPRRSRKGRQAKSRAQSLLACVEPTGLRVHDRTAAGSRERPASSRAGVGRGERRDAPAPGEVSSPEAGVETRRGARLPLVAPAWPRGAPSDTAGVGHPYVVHDRAAPERIRWGVVRGSEAT